MKGDARERVGGVLTVLAEANSQKHQLIRRLSRAVGLWPWLVLAFFVVSALYTRASFGRWPVSVLDDPKDPLIRAAVPPLLWSLLSVVAVVPATLILLAVRQVTGIRPTFDRWAGVALAGAAVCYIVVWSDPFGYVDWLLD